VSLQKNKNSIILVPQKLFLLLPFSNSMDNVRFYFFSKDHK
jgi:hypothetical protein